MYEVIRGGGFVPEVAFMLDQCHNIEAKIPAIIRSVMNVQEATAKALLVDKAALAVAQRSGDVLSANAVLMDAYNTDVRPLLVEVREELGLDGDPIAAYHRSGWASKIAAERVGGEQAGWGRRSCVPSAMFGRLQAFGCLWLIAQFPAPLSGRSTHPSFTSSRKD